MSAQPRTGGSRTRTGEDEAMPLVQSLRVDGSAQILSIPEVEVVAPAISQLRELPAARNNFYLSWGKYILDLAVILLLSPLWITLYAVIALIVLLVDGRPIHYESMRVGSDGKAIGVYKFRTMRPDSDSKLASMLAADPLLMEEFRENVKLKIDPRVTSFGRWLRRSSFDELPQLINVLRGEMSLVGPRPVLESELVEFYGENAPLILSHRPGMTGLWQVSGRSLLSYERRIELDVEYATRCDLRTDLAILARTLPSVLKGSGAF